MGVEILFRIVLKHSDPIDSDGSMRREINPKKIATNSGTRAPKERTDEVKSS